jgi:transcriptional regulator
MYLPKKFQVEDQKLILQVIEEYSFATVISESQGSIQAGHLPLYVEKTDEDLFLVGHMARGNPQWKSFEEGKQVLCIFNGPHSYISPTFYVEPLNVPTWSYVTVHAGGTAATIHDKSELEKILETTVQKYESQKENPWRYELPEDFNAKLVKAIVGFKIKIEKLEAKFKLGQNRNEADYRKVKEHFSKATDPNGQAMYKFMLATEPKFT